MAGIRRTKMFICWKCQEVISEAGEGKMLLTCEACKKAIRASVKRKLRLPRRQRCNARDVHFNRQATSLREASVYVPRAKARTTKGEAVSKRRYTSLHHKKCRSNGGYGGSNLIEVNRESHEAWHKIFSNFEPYRIASIINEVWLDPDFKFICVRR